MDTGDWFDLAQTIAAFAAVGAAIYYSRKALERAEKTSHDTLAIAREQLEHAREAADVQQRQTYEIVGADMAANWRGQVMELHGRGLSPDEIRQVLATEDGVEVGEDGKLNTEPYNGDIDVLVGLREAASPGRGER